jgi:hypothetical protein
MRKNKNQIKANLIVKFPKKRIKNKKNKDQNQESKNQKKIDQNQEKGDSALNQTIKNVSIVASYKKII